MVLDNFENTVDNEVDSIFHAADNCMDEVDNINYGEEPIGVDEDLNWESNDPGYEGE